MEGILKVRQQAWLQEEGPGQPPALATPRGHQEALIALSSHLAPSPTHSLPLGLGHYLSSSLLLFSFLAHGVSMLASSSA